MKEYRLRGCRVDYYGWERFMKYAIVMASGGIIYISSVMTIGSGVQIIVRNLRLCNIDITDGKDL
jgi:hypothetical protein